MRRKTQGVLKRGPLVPYMGPHMAGEAGELLQGGHEDTVLVVLVEERLDGHWGKSHSHCGSGRSRSAGAQGVARGCSTH